MGNKKCIVFLLFAICIGLLTLYANALDSPHDTSNALSCSSCHFTYGNAPTWYTEAPDAGNPDSQYPFNRLCWTCHDGVKATLMNNTHSDFVITGNPIDTWTRECRTCHYPHTQRQVRRWGVSSYLYSGASTSVTSNTIVKTGANWTSNQWQGYVVFGNTSYPNFNYRIVSNTADTLTVQGTINTAYVTAGNTFGIVYGKLVKDYINAKDVKFFRSTGVNSFADGDTARDGICEVCHTQTTHFRNDGAGSDQLHSNFGSGLQNSKCTMCHSHVWGFKPSDELQGITSGGCTTCHALTLGNRVAVVGQLNGNSHHIQGVALTNTHCYQCHWEANSDGSVNNTYHNGAAVDLVIYGAGTRPTGTTYTSGVTGIAYTANGSRTEIAKINSHCLGCHSAQNDSTIPFGDGKTPKQYAWDGYSVGTKYISADTTTWGKYSGANITPKNTQTKAFSAHGNAINNQGGWDLNETWTNTRGGSVNILCFDCHNSHGSTVSGSTTSYTSATASGGILKDITAGKGGYSTTYKPQAGGSAGNKNAYNAGAGLCFDCHQTDNAGTMPWGYSSTFAATQAILGYFDTPYFGPGTFASQQRYPYKSTGHKGGHFGASSALSTSPSNSIGGLCTPCHDPHGVSPTLGTNQQYGVPLLKGTWLAAPYKEDRAPANNTTSTVNDVNAGNAYHIDQNTFGTQVMDSVAGSITEDDSKFAGLCLNCHAKNQLTDGTNGGTWKSTDRIHESIKGWGANAKHKYSCSKCHVPHNSRLPRLMATNCLNTQHKGRVGYNVSPVLSNSSGPNWYADVDNREYSGGAEYGGGKGAFPGSHGGGEGYNPATAGYTYSVTCHENQAADQSWNTKTQWVNSPPTAPILIDEPNTTSTSITLEWNASTDPEGNAIEYYAVVDDDPNFGSPNYGAVWQSGTSLSFTVPVNTTWYWKLKARDIYNSESGWSSSDTFIVSDGVAPPQVTLLSPASSTIYNNYPQNVTFQWNAVPPFAEYRLEIDNESGFSNPLVYDSGWTTDTSRTVSITTAGTYYWRVQARDIVTLATGPLSEVWSFIVNKPPTVPVLVDEPDTTSTSITLDWNASTDPEGNNPVQYYAQVDDDPNFGSPDYGGVWQSGTSLSFTVGINTIWYWRVKAKDSLNFESAWSSMDSFMVSDGVAPPQVTLVSPANGATVLSDFSFQWNAVPPLVEYLVEYSTDSTFNTGVVSPGWIVGISWAPVPGPGTYYWRVKARNRMSLTEGSWSDSWSFTITDGCYADSCCLYGCSTCPTLYSWDGTKFTFETDTFPTGFLGTKTATGWRKPNPYEYHLLESTPQLLGGYYNLKIVEERDETDYFDTLKLYTVDYPLDRDIYQELRTAGIYVPPAQMIHTVDKTLKRPVSITHVNTGENVSAKLAYSDKDYLILNTDRNIDFNWQTLEIDLGDQSLAPQIKLIIDAEMVVPTTSAGMARKLLLSPTGKIIKLEVLDANGNWTLVPATVKEIFSPKERSSAYIVDITNIFTSGTYKFRLSFLYKVYVDAMFFDTTLDVPVTLTELPLVSATLGYYGFSQKTDGELFDYIYGNLVSRDTSYFTGNYTKYGDVTPLLTQTDDKFVIFAGGEELDVRFSADSQPPVGKARRYLVYANGYYKATGNVDISHTVEPLPFASMSNFPYDTSVENYPADAEHQQYLLEYNTRAK